MLQYQYHLILIFIFSSFGSTIYISAQNITIHGHIKDEKGNPIIGANIYIEGTFDGTSSDTIGKFKFTATTHRDVITLIISAIGYKEFKKEYDTPFLNNNKLLVKLSTQDFSLNDIVITASTFSIGKSRTLDKLNPIDIVMQGSSVGDIYGALNALPGTQKVGESGKLYIRGGNDNEAQTFIDGMHVLVPYTSTGQNIPVRGRYSPFLFKGINFSLGGYETKYGQALSSVLPMETKDIALSSKLGFSISPLNWGIGGTYVNKNQDKSVSGNIMYTDLSFYNKIFPDSYNWNKDFNEVSAEIQIKSKIGRKGILKLYANYANTGFIQNRTLFSNDQLFFRLNQNNYYINSTYKTVIKGDINIRGGIAYSKIANKYEDVLERKDQFEEQKDELHLKIVATKKFGKHYKLLLGLEDYIRNSNYIYENSVNEKLQDDDINNSLFSLFLNNQFRLSKGLYFNIGSRTEYLDFTKKRLHFSPRTSIDYNISKFRISAIWSLHYQLANDSIMLNSNPHLLKQEKAIHYIIGGGYDFNKRLLRVELYYKDYKNLHLFNESEQKYNYNGYGKSYGLDVYYKDEKLLPNLKYTISYSYNNSSRLYNKFTDLFPPTFNTKHNANVSLVYFLNKIKTYFGISNSYASGRPYVDKNVGTIPNKNTKAYNSLDVNLTVLIHKNIILYSSLTNILGRENVFGYEYASTQNKLGFYENRSITASRKQFFYATLFVSLFNKSVYDVSNF